MASRAREHDRSTPPRDFGDATPPHGDELQHESQREEQIDGAERKRRFDEIDDAAERDVREIVRRRERSADR